MGIMDNSKWDWLRWVGVLPCAICTIPVVLIVNDIMGRIITYYGSTDPSDVLWMDKCIPISGWFLSGMSFIVTAKYVAPSHKKLIGISFFVIVLILGIVSSTYLITDYYKLFSYTVFALSSALIAFIHFKED